MQQLADIDLIPIVEARGIELRRAGSRHVGTCPFHPDNDPSFYIFPDNKFKCFGCGEYGDSIDFVQKFHSVDFKGALQILGIKQGKLSPKERKEVTKLKHKRELVGAFRKWEVEAADEVAMLCRCCREVLGEIKTEEDLDTYGDRHHDLALYQYHLDILTDHDDQAKYNLWDAELYG